MTTTSTPRWPLHVALGLFLGLMGALLARCLQLSGQVSYALDDAYIHMAMAKSFAEAGVWGITKYSFTSSSSSLLWTSVLAALFKVGGTRELWPLALNVVLGCALLGGVDRRLVRSGAGAGLRVGTLLAVLAFTPLPTLAFTGQEHVLQAVLTVLFLTEAAAALARPEMPLKTLYLLGPLMVLTRFEGLFPAFIVCCLLLLRRRVKGALLLGAATLAPLALFGAYSVAQGWYPLPNSVLMKGNLTKTLVGVLRGSPTSGAFWGSLFDLAGGAALRQLWEAPHLIGLLGAAAVAFGARWRRGLKGWEEGQVLLFLFGATAFFHLELAKVGWFYRYEAYLVVVGILTLALTLPALLGGEGGARTRRVVGAILVLGAWPLGARGVEATLKTAQATQNIHQQQYQMGLFLARYYPGATITANDIGAIAFLADIEVVDLVGLASMEAAVRRRQGRFDRAGMEEMARDAGSTVAVVYTPWIVKWGGVPASWTPVASWTIPNNVVVAFDTVTWYALTPEAEAPLRANLQAFAGELPAGVVVAVGR